MRVEGDVIHAEPGEKWDQSVMRVNAQRYVLIRNIRNNLRRQTPQLNPHPENPQRVAIVGGGWSLDQTYQELRDFVFSGGKLIAINGSAKWLMERNLRPSMHIVLDARPENAEFVREPIPGCKYFLASQCDGSLFEICADRDLTIFHAIAEDGELERKRIDAFYAKRWARIPPCGTVGLTAILLLRFLGFRHIHLFGIDSCSDPETGKHHAFPQSMNDNDGHATFKMCGKEFLCSAWQASQIQSFLNLVAVNGEHFNLTIHGEGVLAHILKVGPEVAAAALKES